MAKARVAVLISGRGSNLAALIYAAKRADCPFEIVLVVANDPYAGGLALAKAEGIATFAKSHKGLKRAEFDAIISAELIKARADYVALAGYMRVLSSEFVAQWQGRILNIHPSLLPDYKGLDTHERALAAGDKVGGCSVHIVTAELDDGQVLGQTKVAIIDGDTPESLAARVSLNINSTAVCSQTMSAAKPRPTFSSLRFARAQWPCPKPKRRCRTACPALASSRARNSAMSRSITTAMAR
jgi:phosphoribosylglycinamide formyltransferase 1